MKKNLCIFIPLIVVALIIAALLIFRHHLDSIPRDVNAGAAFSESNFLLYNVYEDLSGREFYSHSNI